MSDYFKNSILIKNIERSSDKRGNIISIVNTKINNVSIIICNKNSIRSNHYHIKDWHYMFVLEGKINYFYKKNQNSNKVFYRVVKKNQNIFTPPKEIHATHFPVKTTLLVCSKNKRNQKIYEIDTKRVNFINKNNLNYFLKNSEKL